MCIVTKGTWVEVERVVTRPGERIGVLGRDPRAAQVVRVAGFLLEDAELGQQVRVRTIVGNEHTGKLRIENPGYGHSFCHTFPDLPHIGSGVA